MICFCLFVCLFIRSSFAGSSVSFPDDATANGTIQTRFGWSILGEYLKAWDALLGNRLEVPIQTQPASTTLTIPTETEMSPAVDVDPTSFPPLPAMTSPFPVFNFFSTSSPTGIVPPSGSFPSAAASESVSTIAGFTKCECMPTQLCVNSTVRSEATTRIVTRPPTGIVCPAGEVYCCIESPKFGCGLPNIVPGVTPMDGQADLGEFPWSVIILTTDDVYVGGGALIDATHVLTAAHKVAKYGNGANLKVRLGDWDLSKEDEPVNFLEVRISKIVNHPKFEANTLKNDISVITLASPVSSLTKPYPQINTICMPESKTVFTGLRCKVAGWGKDQFNGNYQNVIKKVEVPVLSSVECQAKLRKTRLGSSFVLDTNSFICAGGEAGRDACTGDGGNALACSIGGHHYIAGITAGGIECGNENVPGLYVNLVNYLTWINTETGGSGGGIDPRRRPS